MHRWMPGHLEPRPCAWAPKLFWCAGKNYNRAYAKFVCAFENNLCRCARHIEGGRRCVEKFEGASKNLALGNRKSGGHRRQRWGMLNWPRLKLPRILGQNFSNLYTFKFFSSAKTP